jgi:hypothetical protein
VNPETPDTPEQKPDLHLPVEGQPIAFTPPAKYRPSENPVDPVDPADDWKRAK